MIEVVRQYFLRVHPKEKYYLGGDLTRLPENDVLIMDANVMEREEFVYPYNIRVCFYHKVANDNIPQSVADVYDRAYELILKIPGNYRFDRDDNIDDSVFHGKVNNIDFGNKRYVINWMIPYTPYLSTCNSKQLVLDVDMFLRYSVWYQDGDTWHDYAAYARFLNPAIPQGTLAG